MSHMGLHAAKDAGEDSEVRADLEEAGGNAKAARIWARSAGHHYSLAALDAEGVSLELALSLSHRAERCYRRGLTPMHRHQQSETSKRLERELAEHTRSNTEWLAALRPVDERGEEPT